MKISAVSPVKGVVENQKGYELHERNVRNGLKQGMRAQNHALTREDHKQIHLPNIDQ